MVVVFDASNTQPLTLSRVHAIDWANTAGVGISCLDD